MIRRLTALAACAALALVPLTGCGGGKKRDIPSDEGATLIRLLKQARSQAGDPKQCDALARTIARLQAEVQSLPSNVSGGTRDSLTNGVNNLASSSQDQCSQVQTTPTTTETTPTTPSTSSTQSTPSTTNTQPSTPSNTQSTPSNTQQTTPPPAGGNGGTTVPPGQGKKGAKKDPPKGPRGGKKGDNGQVAGGKDGEGGD